MNARTEDLPAEYYTVAGSVMLFISAVSGFGVVDEKKKKMHTWMNEKADSPPAEAAAHPKDEWPLHCPPESFW